MKFSRTETDDMMQCYESEALRLQLYADARLLTPGTPFDPLALDQALDEFEIQRIGEYEALGLTRRANLARRAAEISSPGPRPVQPGPAPMTAAYAASLS
ncbi:MAG: hypothetical protein WB783_06390 [Arenicellales bacterium]